MYFIYYLLVFYDFCNIFSGVICNFVQYLPQLSYLMDFINYCISNFYLSFSSIFIALFIGLFSPYLPLANFFC